MDNSYKTFRDEKMREIITKRSIGYSTSKGVLLDLDRTPLEKVKEIAEEWMKTHKLKGYIIAETSKGLYDKILDKRMSNYSLIFDRRMSWGKALSIASKVAFYFGFKHDHLNKWLLIQVIKGYFTVRVSSKGKKGRPKVIEKVGRIEEICQEYLEVYSLCEDLEIRNSLYTLKTT